MSVLTINRTMLYCPKCRSTYEEGTQRFCSNDGGRLLPAPSSQDKNLQKTGVFTSILGKMPPKDAKDKNISDKPKSFEIIEKRDKPKVSLAEKMFKVEQELKPTFESLMDDDSILELEVEPPYFTPEPKVEELPELEKIEEPITFEPFEEPFELEKIEEPISASEVEIPKPLPKLVNREEIASGTADVGNRQKNPIGRTALSWKNPNALIGHTVKGRYFITVKIQEDADSLVYRAEDKIAAGKKVIVRVFMDEDSSAAAEFNDEIVALSHINHPNIAAIFDSGELSEGNKFIVSEFVEGKSLKEMLNQSGQFNVKRTARIIRQISYALSEAHQNSILHRNLKPENIVLTVSENGIEQVKLMNFGLSEGDWLEEDLQYKSPEEIEGELPTFASEIYSLAVITYQMLTGKMPFNALTEGELLRAQSAGLTVPPTTLRLDVPPLADKILEKSLLFEPDKRYPKARDFGDAFFNALTTIAPWEEEEKTEEKTEETAEIDVQQKPFKPSEFFVVPPIKAKTTEEDPLTSDIHIDSEVKEDSEEDSTEAVAAPKTREERTWEKRSPEPPKQTNWLWSILPVLGVLALLTGLWGMWQYYASSRQDISQANQTSEIPANIPQTDQTSEIPANIPPTPEEANVLSANTEIDMPPPARSVTQPPNTLRYGNDKGKLDKELARNFLGFELFYPNDWVKKDSDTNFLDVSKRSSNGSLLKQFLVTHYESRGSYTLDKDKFQKFAEKSNAELKKYLGDNFKVISQGETTIQDGRWKGFEVKFQSKGTNQKGEDLIIWGRRLWIPVQSPGTQNGFVITMLATSLSDDVKSIEDVGVKGELASILESFQPEQN